MGDPLVLPRAVEMTEDWPSWMAADLAGPGSDEGVELERLYLSRPMSSTKLGSAAATIT